MNALTVIEQTQLQDLEAVIEKGLQTFFDVGNALGEIRSQRLYRASHETFEEYCNERWGMSRSYASRVIGAADVVNNLLPIGNSGDPLPANESQARPLVGLEPEQQQKAWTTAVKATGGKPTAAAVKQAAEAIATDWGPVPEVGPIREIVVDDPEFVATIRRSYSADLLTRDKMRKPFEFEGEIYVKIGEMSQPNGIDTLMAVRVVKAKDFTGQTLTYRDISRRGSHLDWIERDIFYYGMIAKHDSGEYVLVYPEIYFIYHREEGVNQERSARERVSQALDDLWGTKGRPPASWSANIMRRWLKDGVEDPSWHVLEARTNDLTSSEVQAALMAHLAATNNTPPEDRPTNPYMHGERPVDPKPPLRCPRNSCRADFSRQPPEKIAVNHWRCPACLREMDSNGRVPAAAPIHEAEEPPVTQNEERKNASHRELEELTREWLIKNHGSVPCDESWQTMSRIKERDGFDGFDRLYSYARTRTKLRIRPGDLWAVCLALYDYIQKDRNDGAVTNYDQTEGEIANTEDLMAWSKSAGRWTCPKCKEESMFWTGEEGRCLECHFAYLLTIPAIDAGGEASPITPENIDEFDKILSNGGAVVFETPQETNPSINSDGVYKIAVTKLVDYVRTWVQKERAGRWEVLDEITNGRGTGDEIEALRCWLPVATEHYYVADLTEACRIVAEEQRPEALTYLQTAERALSRAIVALDPRTQREALLKTNSAYQNLMQALDMLKEKTP